MKEQIDLRVEETDNIKAVFALTGAAEMLSKMSNLSSFDQVPAGENFENSISFLSGNDKYIAIIEKEIDVAAEKIKLAEEIKYQEGFLSSVEKKLSNDRFVAGAPKAVVDKERKKLADGQDRLRILQENLAKLD